MSKICHIYESSLGEMLIQSQDEYIVGLDFLKGIENQSDIEFGKSSVIDQCIKQLDEYFQGNRKNFDIKYLLSGTEFRKNVWKELVKIPFGETVSYKYIAMRVGNPKAVRAVGGANHNNKIIIIVPCHRVIGVNGSLTGYGGELWRKKWLLEFEKMVG